MLIFSGIVATPGETPAMQVARVFLQITGIGFGFYCLTAFGLLLAGVRMRATAGARRPHAREWP
ncbi:hypothetical protein AGRA3207_004980 [Actinomadura graeca]|uniref:Uncharacterized protein n=1 Tax=Actinomadura graeca TaxID=2750812 RepID=A0ABX8QYS6_9ACTN|nr:hypothetical protein [Actinomadura graeca]QXJ23778.1 hypothetical protein AGRA3207_004980 [Actinomadura graeca]